MEIMETKYGKKYGGSGVVFGKYYWKKCKRRKLDVDVPIYFEIQIYTYLFISLLMSLSTSKSMSYSFPIYVPIRLPMNFRICPISPHISHIVNNEHHPSTGKFSWFILFSMVNVITSLSSGLEDGINSTLLFT